MSRKKIYINNLVTTTIYKNLQDKCILATNTEIYEYLKENTNKRDVIYLNNIRLGTILSLHTKNKIVIKKTACIRH